MDKDETTFGSPPEQSLEISTEVKDAQVAEFKPAQLSMNEAPKTLMPVINKFIATAGTLELSREEMEVLNREIKDEEIEIRPDGLLFPGWYFCADRLNEAFGGQWSVVPLPLNEGDEYATGVYDSVKNIYYRRFALFIRGNFISDAVGEQVYFKNNQTMSQGDAMEGSKSNAILRLCKPLIKGMRKLWSQSFISYWKDTYAEAYYAKEKQKLLWRKKGTRPDGTDFYEFLKEMGKIKVNLVAARPQTGEKLYHNCLKMFGCNKANEVKKAKHRREILILLRQIL